MVNRRLRERALCSWSRNPGVPMFCVTPARTLLQWRRLRSAKRQTSDPNATPSGRPRAVGTHASWLRVLGPWRRQARVSLARESAAGKSPRSGRLGRRAPRARSTQNKAISLWPTGRVSQANQAGVRRGCGGFETSHKPHRAGHDPLAFRVPGWFVGRVGSRQAHAAWPWRLLQVSHG